MAWTNATNILDGINSLGTLIDGVSTGVSTIRTTTASVLNELENTTYGLEAIKNALGGDSDVLTIVTAIQTSINNATYGLEALKQYLIG